MKQYILQNQASESHAHPDPLQYHTSYNITHNPSSHSLADDIPKPTAMEKRVQKTMSRIQRKQPPAYYTLDMAQIQHKTSSYKQ